MTNEALQVDCAEWREVAETDAAAMEVIMEMMIEAEEELCEDEAA